MRHSDPQHHRQRHGRFGGDGLRAVPVHNQLLHPGQRAGRHIYRRLPGIYVANFGTCWVTGNVTGGTGTASYGIQVASGGTVTVYGNVSVNTSTSSPGICNANGGTVNVTNPNSTTPALLTTVGMYLATNGLHLNLGTAAQRQLTGVTMMIVTSAGSRQPGGPAVLGPFSLNAHVLNGVSINGTTYYFNSYPSNQYSDPGVSNVLHGVTTVFRAAATRRATGIRRPWRASRPMRFGVGNTSLTGGLAKSKIMDATYGTLATSSVLSTAGGTYVLPPVTSVISTQSYGVSNGTTGTYDVSQVAAGNIVHGVSIGGVAGNQYVPAAGNVRSGTATGTTGGTLAVPSPANVLSGVATDATTGTYWPPPAASVVNTQNFGAGSNGTTGGTQGTLDLAGDEASYYANGQAAQLAADSTTVAGYAASILSTATILGTTGTVTLPPQGKVQNDTSYGAAGTQFTGTIDLTFCVPSNIKSTVIIAGVTGTLEPSATGMLTLYA